MKNAFETPGHWTMMKSVLKIKESNSNAKNWSNLLPVRAEGADPCSHPPLGVVHILRNHVIQMITVLHRGGPANDYGVP